MPPARATAFSLVLTALGYWALALLARHFFAPEGVVGVFWPAAGWALGRVLMLGRHQAWAVFAGACFHSVSLGDPLEFAVLAGLAPSGLTLAGYTLLRRHPALDLRFPTITDYFRLGWRGVVAAPIVSAVLGVLGLAVADLVPPAGWVAAGLRWWCGDALGVLVITPLLLAWRRPLPRTRDLFPWLEGTACLVLAVLLGQIVFLGAYRDVMGHFPAKGYWLFPLLIWSAMRLGLRHQTLLVGLIAVQAMLGVRDNTAFFSSPSIDARLADAWFYLAVISLTGMTLAIYFRERRRSEEDLRIAAIAFECQEGIIVVDPDLHILRTNQSFSRITGYEADEVLHRTTGFLRSDRHPPEFYENVWRTAREQGTWTGQMWHRRKNGEIFPQWITVSRVIGERQAITHFVVTHTDLTELKKQESEQLARHIAQRDALVREVHHRIKNSLQGITGMLRQFARTYPQTEAVMSHAISLIKGIAVLHGLQGRASARQAEAVWLDELLHSMAQDLRSVWRTEVTVDLVARERWRVADNETVPMAMVLSELLVNAIKHGGSSSGHVGITLEGAGTSARITISNEGQLPPGTDEEDKGGLMLIESMMPRSGAELSIEQLGGHVVTRLELSAPVIAAEPRNQNDAR